MWAVAQKGCCWAPAKGPHRGSQIISVRCEYDGSSVAGEAWLHSHLLLLCCPVLEQGKRICSEGGWQEHWWWRGWRRQAAFRAQSSHLPDFGVGPVPSQVLNVPSLAVSLVFGCWPQWAGPFLAWGPSTTLNKTSLLCAQMRGLRELGEEHWAGSAEPLRGEGPSEKLPVRARVAPRARIAASHTVHEVWQSWGRGRLERGKKWS